MRTVAVAVNGGSAAGEAGKGSKRAFQWALDNLMPQADRLILVHVIPMITSIPTPTEESVPLGELDASLGALYVEDVKLRFERIFIPFKKLCNSRMVETLLLEDDNPADALVRFISDSRIEILVMGSFGNVITRKLKGPGVPETVLRSAPGICDIYIVAKDGIISKLAHCGTSSGSCSSTEIDSREGSSEGDRRMSGFHSFSSETKASKTFVGSSISGIRYLGSQTFSDFDCSAYSNITKESNLENSGDDFDITSIGSASSTKSQQSSVVREEVKKLRLELQNTIAMYKRVCEELVHAQSRVLSLSSECVEEARKVALVSEREETLRKIAAEEKAKHLKATKELEAAKELLAQETYEREMVELTALKESIEKRRIVEALFSNDTRYRKYTKNEIEVATDSFSEANVIGEGGYGKVYKCSLDHTQVAVKVLRHTATEKKEEFLKEVEILSQLRHPHLVLLIGACPDSGCLVYEYLENGSLEEHIYCQKERPPLPWFVRVRIILEVACGLSYLHNSKPEPIVHRDLKPGNILLDRNYVSKIGDVGLAKLLSEIVPDDITEYRDSVIAGTLCYMDPEYQRTGTIRPKSDTYALGVIILQMLTGSRPRGVVSNVENAISNGSFSDILDISIRDWPLAGAVELAQLALKCTKLKCRDRPHLDTEVLPVLKRLSDAANTAAKLERDNIRPSSQYYCPILQEVMDDPHIAADGFTYEYRAIKAWLSKHNTSPVTDFKLHNSTLTPNHTLRSAIQEWRSRVTMSSADT